MSKRWYRFLFLLFCVGALYTCIDPYTPNLEKFQSLLVVEAFLTDADESNYVRLTRSVETLNDEPAKVSGATVVISDDLGNSTSLAERSIGEYRTDSLLFRGESGRTYTLHITTVEGQEYESEPCLMYHVPDIDSLYFVKDQVISAVTGKPVEGVGIYIDSKGDGASNYYRWTYHEWWKFRVPDPRLFNYINDSVIIPAVIKQTCWTSKESDEIMVKSVPKLGFDGFEKKPILFVGSEETNRLTVQYCIEVRQLSLSEKEFEFWNLMTKLNESGGDIFDKQPFQVNSNIKCITDPDEMILGYFQVSGLKSKKIYITVNEILDLDLPVYRYECERLELGEIDFESFTFDEIYAAFTNSTTNYTFIKPILTAEGDLFRLIFVRPWCADCSLNGSLSAPDFWVDAE